MAIPLEWPLNGNAIGQLHGSAKYNGGKVSCVALYSIF